MKDLKKFNHTVNVLLKAYLNDTLEHGNCTKCAVGNILANGEWAFFFHTTTSYQKKSRFKFIPDTAYLKGGRVHLSEHPDRANLNKVLENITVSGYTIEQLECIENTFEDSVQDGMSKDTNMFNGLMAVVDVLAEIHEIDLETVKETKHLFV